MGAAAGYRCEGCGYCFDAVDDFSYGFLGEVVTPVVCPEHGLVTAEAGMNVAHGEWRPEVARKRKFPCPECGGMAQRWNRKSCPKCGERHLEVTSQIMWD